MHPQNKNDKVLGWEVHDHLMSLGIETPMIIPERSADERLMLLEENFESIMRTLGLDLMDDSLKETPRRLAKMYLNEIFWGMDHNNFPKCTSIRNSLKQVDVHGSFVLEKGIRVSSTCEHHFVPIDGKATVAYIPRDKILGLSKLNRIVEYFSKRPQVQERLTEQIRAALSFVAETNDVAVFIDATHFCVKTRGIQDVGSTTVTLSVGGVFAEDKSDIRREFLNLARMN
jgi:GTP cyclohydrolase I